MITASVRRSWRRGAFEAVGVALFVAVTAGCGGGADGLSGFKPPTGPTLSLDQLTGSWGGRIDTGSSGNVCWNLAWTATQDATRATGRMEILGTGVPFVNPLSGVMTATSTGSGYAVTLSVNPGLSGPAAACTMTGTANVDAGLAPSGTGEQVLLGPVTMEWAPACAGVVYSASSPNSQGGHLLLVKNSPVSGGC